MAIESLENIQLVKIIEDTWNDRVAFMKNIIGVTPTNQQGDGLRALDKNDHVAVKSGHGTGKSLTQSVAILHYMSTRNFPKVPCTAPSKHQLFDVLWAELSKWHRQMNPLFRSQFQWTKEKFFHKRHPEEWFAVARTATKENPEALQGFHADYILRVVDEASGVPDSIFEVADGAHGRLETKELMCGNPTRLDGTFYDAFNKSRASYKGLTWSCIDSPVVPIEFAPRIVAKYGMDSSAYRVRVLGEFPLTDSDSFIPFHYAESAVSRDILPQKDYPIVFGVDVARFGDDETVIALRQGDEIYKPHILRGKDTMQVAGYVAQLANRQKPIQIYIDVIGIGAGVFDRLNELGYPVVAVNVSEAPATDATKYKRLRDELWGLTRDWLETRRGRLWDNEDGDIVAQLTTPRYRFTSDGKIIIETKDEMKKRGLASPNIADAINMTLCQPIMEYSKEVDEFFADLDAGSDEGTMLDPECGY